VDANWSRFIAATIPVIIFAVSSALWYRRVQRREREILQNALHRPVKEREEDSITAWMKLKPEEIDAATRDLEKLVPPALPNEGLFNKLGRPRLPKRT